MSIEQKRKNPWRFVTVIALLGIVISLVGMIITFSLILGVDQFPVSQRGAISPTELSQNIASKRNPQMFTFLILGITSLFLVVLSLIKNRNHRKMQNKAQ